MSGTFEYDVFLSYSSMDKEIVQDLVKRLERGELRMWLDARTAKPTGQHRASLLFVQHQTPFVKRV